MVNKEHIFVVIQNLEIVDQEYIARSFKSYVDQWELGKRLKKDEEDS